VASALDEAALGRNPNLRWAMATARRVGIATGFFEGHPGILKVTVTESFRSAPALEYTLGELWEAYSEHRPYDEPGVIELWEGDANSRGVPPERLLPNDTVASAGLLV
jgi:hypothetical protein